MDDDKPRFDHDCKHCVFLGGYYGPYASAPARRYDLYVCRSPDEETRRVMGDTVIARYGSSDQYISGDRKVLEHAGYTDGPLGEAMQRTDTYDKKGETPEPEGAEVDWVFDYDVRHYNGEITVRAKTREEARTMFFAMTIDKLVAGCNDVAVDVESINGGEES